MRPEPERQEAVRPEAVRPPRARVRSQVHLLVGRRSPTTVGAARHGQLGASFPAIVTPPAEPAPVARARMILMAWHPEERAALADALLVAGPGAPTCCAGWRTEQLAAHVLLRERAPLVAAGIVLPPLAGRTERVTQRRGAAAAHQWDETIAQVRSGPPWWSPLRWAGDGAQLVELFVHTEDVRRGAGRGSALPRELPSGEQDALWAGLVRVAPLLYRDLGVGVVVSDGTRTARVRTPRGARDGRPTGRDVLLRGGVGELVLHAWGRARVALVELDGEDDAVVEVAAAFPS